MFEYSITDLELAQSYGQQISVREKAFNVNYDKTDETTYTEIANVQGYVEKNIAPETILPTGEVIVQSEYSCHLYEAVNKIEEGYILETSYGTLYVDSFDIPFGINETILGLTTQVK